MNSKEISICEEREDELMNVRELREARMKLDDMEAFKKIVAEAVEGECKYKEFGYWLHEEHKECSDDSHTCYRATVVCINETYNDEYKYFKQGWKDVSSITCYDIFYTDITGGCFVIEQVILNKGAIDAIRRLKAVK